MGYILTEEKLCFQLVIECDGILKIIYIVHVYRLVSHCSILLWDTITMLPSGVIRRARPKWKLLAGKIMELW